MTSLYMAAKKGREISTEPPSISLHERTTKFMRKENGIFENSFQGLDLSEFSCGGTPSNSNVSSLEPEMSASAKLLQIKKKEAKLIKEEEEEEAMMEQQALKRAKKQTELLLRKREMNQNNSQSSGNGQMLSSLVSSMHQGDVSRYSYKKNKIKQTLKRNGKQQRRNAVVGRNISGSSLKKAKFGGSISKKSSKAKHFK